MKAMKICNFCGSGEATHYCEECKASFCGRCARKRKTRIIICVNCGAFVGKPKKQRKTIVCSDCNLASTKSAIKYITTCPNCSSKTVVRIKKKNHDLLIRFKNAISSLVSGYYILKRFLAEVNIVRRKIIAIRYYGFRQYPELEKTLITVYSEVHVLGQNLVDTVFRILRGLDSELPTILKKRPWDSKDFPLVESLIEQLTKDGQISQKDLMNRLNDLRQKVVELLPLVRSLEYFREVYNSIGEHLILGKYEKIISAFSNVSLSSNSFKRSRNNATLVLTNRRILFHQQPKGKKTSNVIETRLNDLKSYSVDETDGRITLETMNDKVEFLVSQDAASLVERFLKVAKRYDENLVDLDRLNRLTNIQWVLSDLCRMNKELQIEIFKVLGEKPRLLDSKTVAASAFGEYSDREYSDDISEQSQEQPNMSFGIEHEFMEANLKKAVKSQSCKGTKPKGVIRRIANLFKNDRNCQLSDLVLEIGKKSKANTGGVIPLAEVYLSIKELRPNWNIDIEEVEKAIETLKEKGLIVDFSEHNSGIKVVEFFPLEFSNDKNAVMDLAAERGHITLEDVIRNTGWLGFRAVRALKGLEKIGIAKLDPTYSRGKRWYFPYLK